MEDCVFCKIVKGEIPSYKIYEDKYVLAFLDIAADVYGHTLVIPKKHFQNILDVDKKYLKKVMEAVQKISKHYVENCGIDRVNLFNINEDVQHFHIHIIPRTKNDGLKVLNDLKKIPNMNFEEALAKFKLN